MGTASVRSELLELASRVEELPLVVVRGTGGAGKTTLLSAWRVELEKRDCPTIWLRLAPVHGDPSFLLEDLADAIRERLPGLGLGAVEFGETLERHLPHLHEGEAASLARVLRRACRALPRRVHVFLGVGPCGV